MHWCFHQEKWTVHLNHLIWAWTTGIMKHWLMCVWFCFILRLRVHPFCERVSDCLFITSRVKQNEVWYKSCQIKSINHMQTQLMLCVVCLRQRNNGISIPTNTQIHKQTFRDLMSTYKLVWLMSRNYRLNWSCSQWSLLIIWVYCSLVLMKLLIELISDV